MTSQVSFGSWLKQRRKALGIAQDELARKIGCATITLQKIEANDRRPSRQMVENLANALGIQSDQRDAFLEFARSPSTSGTSFQYHKTNRMPSSTTPFIGRDQDVESVLKLLNSDIRLLTLVGAPGIGKTRLALEVAAKVQFHFDQGSFFVPLAAISDPNLVLSTIGQVLSIFETNNRSWLDRLSDYLHLKRVLLILDNFEQVLPAASQVAQLLATCPLLKVIVTSRAALRVRAERVYVVQSLSLPDLGHLKGKDALTSFGAIAMFLDRAQAVAPDFEINELNELTIAQICHRLDGLPLAIELIAAWIPILTPKTLLERLSGSLLLETDGLHDVDERQRTLQRAITWSYNLLTAEEQTLFKQLGVFVGGWTLEAAETVCSDQDRAVQLSPESEALNNQSKAGVIDLLSALVNKSMVMRHVQDGDIRFSFLETIREYALAQLKLNNEAPALKRRHAEYYLALAQEASPHFHHAGEADWLHRLNRERDNLRAALDWAFQTSDSCLLAELAMTFADMAWMDNLLIEADTWLERALLLSKDAEVQPLTQLRLLNDLGLNAFLRGHYESGQKYHEKALEIANNLEDVSHKAFTLFALALSIYNMGDLERAEFLWQTAYPLARSSGNYWTEAMILVNLSIIAHRNGDIHEGIHLCQQALQLMYQTGDELFLTMLLNNLGAMLRKQGRFDEAMAIHLDCLHTTNEIGNIREVSFSLEKLAGVWAAKGDFRRAARLLGAASVFRVQSNAPIDASYKDDYDEILAQIRGNVTLEQFSSAWAEGQAMSLEQAVAYEISVSE